MQHTFGFEFHGIGEIIEEIQQKLRGTITTSFVRHASNGTFLTVDCPDCDALARAGLVVGFCLREHLSQTMNHPVDAQVTFVERSLQTFIPSPPVRYPTSSSPDPRTHPRSEDTPR